MKWLFPILMLAACLASHAEDKAQTGVVPKADRKMAEQEFKRALELRKDGQVEEALLAATHAAQLVPSDSEYLVTREMLRQQIVSAYIEKGNRLAQAGDNAGAATQFREALARDPENTYAQQRLGDMMQADNPDQRRVMELLASVDNAELAPLPGKRSIHAGPDLRSVYTQIGKAFGINFTFDQSLTSRPLRLDLDNVDFYTVTSLLGKMTKSFWAPVSDKDAIVANDTQEMRKAYERMAVRSFYVGNVATPTDLNDLANMIRGIFDMKLLSIQVSKNTITVRAPREKIEAVATFLDSIMDAKPEIMLEVQEFELDSDKASHYGLNLPTDFVLFNIPSEIRRVLGGGAQSVIDQLNKTGTIDPSKISPTDLQNLQNSPLLQPFVFFGKGLGLTGIVVPPISGTLSATKSSSVNMEHVTLRAIDGEPAIFRSGSRFPIVTSNFTSVALSSRGQLQTGQTPQFTYVDLGLSLKVTPHYHADGDIKLDLDLEIQGQGAQTFNGLPDLTTRSFKGNITAREGEPSVVTGLITDQELRATQGYPGIGQLPVLRGVLNTNSRDRAHNEILVVITPYVVRKPFHDRGASTLWNLN